MNDPPGSHADDQRDNPQRGERARARVRWLRSLHAPITILLEGLGPERKSTLLGSFRIRFHGFNDDSDRFRDQLDVYLTLAGAVKSRQRRLARIR